MVLETIMPYDHISAFIYLLLLGQYFMGFSTQISMIVVDLLFHQNSLLQQRIVHLG